MISVLQLQFLIDRMKDGKKFDILGSGIHHFDGRFLFKGLQDSPLRLNDLMERKLLLIDDTKKVFDKNSCKTFSDYQQLALVTANKDDFDNKDIIMNAILGLNGESGELADAMKKAWFQGHRADHDKLIEELGDVLWYVSLLAYGLNIPLEDVAYLNIYKLQNRYPNGFEADRSINRKEGTE